MTGEQHPAGRDPAPTSRRRTDSPADTHAEQVLAQALRLMAGGGSAADRRSGQAGRDGRRLTTGQLLLLASIVGLLVGIVAGFVSLL